MPQVPYQPFQGEVGGGEINYQQIGGRGGPSAESFGSGIGSALTQVAQTTDKAVGDVTSAYITWQRQIQNTDHTANHINFDSRWRTTIQQRTQEAQGTQTNTFYSGLMTEMNNDMERELNRIPSGPQRDQFRLQYMRSIQGMQTGVLNSQMTISNAAATQQISTSQDQLLNRIATDPTQREAALAENERLVRASPFAPGLQNDMILHFRQRAATATVAEMTRRDPEQMAAHLGGQTSFRSTVRQYESANNDRAMAPGSSATGRYQFLTDTWGVSGRDRGLANTPEGRAAGLRPIPAGGERGANDPRFDPAQQEIAMGVAEQRYARVLRQPENNFPVNGANLYILHFLGESGGASFLRQWRENPNAPAATLFPEAARRNQAVFYAGQGEGGSLEPRTLQQVYANRTARFGNSNPVVEGAPPPAIAEMNYQDRQSAIQTATTAAARQQAVDLARVTESNNAALNSVQAAITEGRAGRPEIDRLWQTAVLTDAGTRDRLYASVDRRDAELNLTRSFDGLVATGQGVNPHDATQTPMVNAAYQRALRQTGDPIAAGMQVWEQSGALPGPAADALLNMTNSTNTAAITRAAEMLLQIGQSQRSTEPFAGMSNGPALRVLASDIAYARTTGKTIPQIAQMLSERNTPDHARTTPANVERVRQFETEMNRTAGSNIRGMLVSWYGYIPGTRPTFMEGQEQQAISDYVTFAREYYQNVPDSGAAKAHAEAQMRELWGVSNNWLVRLPAERIFQPRVDPITGRSTQEYIYNNALDVVRNQGIQAERGNIVLEALTNGATREGFNARSQDTPYGIRYRYQDPQGFWVTSMVRVEGRQLTRTMSPQVVDPRTDFGSSAPGPALAPQNVIEANRAAREGPFTYADSPAREGRRAYTVAERQEWVRNMNAREGFSPQQQRERDDLVLQETTPVTADNIRYMHDERGHTGMLPQRNYGRGGRDPITPEFLRIENERRQRRRALHFSGREAELHQRMLDMGEGVTRESF